MIGLLGVQSHPRQEAERLVEILDLESPEERLAALLASPAFEVSFACSR